MSRLNVMHIRDSSGLYGAERVLLALARQLDPARFKFLLVCLQDRQGSARPLIEKARGMGIQVEVIPVRSAFDPAAVFGVRKLLKRYAIHLIHTHDFKATLFGMLASVRLGIKRVATLHGSVKDSLKMRLSLWLEEQIIRHSFDMAIVVAEELQRQLLSEGFRPGMLRLIRNGIDLSSFASGSPGSSKAMKSEPEQGNKVFGVVGRLVPDKGHKYFLNALSRMKPQYPTMKAVIVGNGSFKEEIEREIARLGLEHQVLLHGVRSDMAELYRQMHCLVIPSLREGLPYVLLEALASKVPVIASAVGDIPKLIRHAETGYLVPPANSVELQKYMTLVLKEPDTARRLADKGYQVVLEGYSSNRMVQETQAVYSALVQ